MLSVTVHALWGVREESPAQLATRWVRFLRSLAEMDELGPAAWRAAESEGDMTAPPVELEVAAVAEYLELTNPEPDAPYIGYTSSLWAGQLETVNAVVGINAGGSANRVSDSCVVKLRSTGSADSAELLRRSADVLVALAECWDADWGEAYVPDEYRAVKAEFGLRASTPRGGRSVYLSPGRAARAPEGLPGTYVRTDAGGLVIDLTRGGTQTPAVETVVEANRQLFAAGALEPLAVPFDRDRF
ncbi:Imm52 family immunity protein [Streptomyces sp. NPDC058382]|uniref:Imm52 family immunity protein n=1 Tax=unclassified Streptomyces TaxID=2593676 RepID=UPI00363CC19C